jgi:hypothetical protein
MLVDDNCVGLSFYLFVYHAPECYAQLVPASIISRVSIGIHIPLFVRHSGCPGHGARRGDSQCHDSHHTAQLQHNYPIVARGLGVSEQTKAQSSTALHGRTSCCPVNLPVSFKLAL